MMKNNLLADLKESNNITIVGTTAISDHDFLRQLEDVLLDDKKNIFIFAESDNQLFQFSLLTDNISGNRISFEELKYRRDFFYKKMKRNEGASYKLLSLYIPSFIVKTDDYLWYLPSNNFERNNYIKATKDDKEYSIYNDYIKFLLSESGGFKYSSNPGAELLELFDQKQVPRGIFPRDSFYGTDHYQYVIWGFVFNREGKLLIHKRSENAKDNQGMWDKSIGGHIDFNIERSSSDAAVRELIEELYTKEKKQQTGHNFSMLSEDLTKVYYLGDWRIENFGPDYLRQVEMLESDKKHGEENWVFFKVPQTLEHNTPRLLPDGEGEKWLRVLADQYIFITNTTMNDESLTELENSQYRLVDPQELKNWMDARKDDSGNEFIVTPDLKFIMTGKLRDLIDQVSLTIKYSDIRKIS